MASCSQHSHLIWKEKLAHHGVSPTTLVKRWQKKSTSERETLLLVAKPKMYRHKYLQAHLHYRLMPTRTLDEQIRFHEEWLLPWLDVPTLSKSSNNLLALLRHRTKNSPSEWVAFDNKNLEYAFSENTVKTTYNLHCVVMGGVDYGKLVPWESEAAHKWDIIGYPRALVILRVQNSLSDFLRRTVDLLLVSEADGGNYRWSAMVEAGFVQKMEKTARRCAANILSRRPRVLRLRTFWLHCSANVTPLKTN